MDFTLSTEANKFDTNAQKYTFIQTCNLILYIYHLSQVCCSGVIMGWRLKSKPIERLQYPSYQIEMIWKSTWWQPPLLVSTIFKAEFKNCFSMIKCTFIVARHAKKIFEYCQYCVPYTTFCYKLISYNSRIALTISFTIETLCGSLHYYICSKSLLMLLQRCWRPMTRRSLTLIWIDVWYKSIYQSNSNIGFCRVYRVFKQSCTQQYWSS